MQILGFILAAYAATWLVPRIRGRITDQWRYALAAGMAIAGVAHLVEPAPFIQHIPPWVPAREPLVLLTGLAEIALAAALLTAQPHRRRAGLALAAFLLAVFPANVYVAVAGIDVQGQPGGLYPWLRLPVQAVFVWLALWTTRRHEPADKRDAAQAIAPALHR